MGFSGPKQIYFLILVLIFLSGVQCVGGETVVAQTSNAASETGKNKRPSGSYCGIYCLYAAMKYFDIDVEPNDLLRGEYIGTTKGSSLAELKKAASDHKLFAEPVAKLTTKELRRSSYPIILHVKSSPAKKAYDHYELFFKSKDGQAYLYDPPQPVRLVPFYELVPRWDGTGVVISNKPIDVIGIFAPARRRFAMWAAIMVAAVLGVRWGRSRLRPVPWFLTLRGRMIVSVIKCAVVAATALLAATVYHFINEEGFFARGDATAVIQEAYRGSFIPTIGEREIVGLLKGDKAVFVDARDSIDFLVGHLQGAINVPASATEKERRAATANIDKSARIVVYCQNASCGFARLTAEKLLGDGFSNVCIYRAGWEKLAAKRAK